MYNENPITLHLRAMNTLYEIMQVIKDKIWEASRLICVPKPAH